eukprot:6461278-Amphidinium_carterae.1
MQALHRRGAAADIGGVLTFEVHDKLAQVLVKELSRVPPTGYQKISLEQISRVEAWKLVSARCTSGLQPDAMGKRPVDTAMEEVLVDPAFRLLLLPLPQVGQLGKRSAVASGHDEVEASLPKKVKRAAVKPKAAPRQAPRLPPGLEGASTSKDGAAICFAYNLGTCKAQSQKGCPRGKHVCTKCNGPHPFTSCPDKKGAQYQ